MEWEQRIHRKRNRNRFQAPFIREMQIKIIHVQKLTKDQQLTWKI